MLPCAGLALGPLLSTFPDKLDVEAEDATYLSLTAISPAKGQISFLADSSAFVVCLTAPSRGHYSYYRPFAILSHACYFHGLQKTFQSHPTFGGHSCAHVVGHIHLIGHPLHTTWKGWQPGDFPWGCSPLTHHWLSWVPIQAIVP